MIMDDAFFASAEKIECHRTLSIRELELAEELVHSIEKLGSLLTESDDHCHLILGQAKALKEFFREMNLFMENFEGRVLETSHEMNKILTRASDGLHFVSRIYQE